MSLLMDALKKAEREKKEAAERQKEIEAPKPQQDEEVSAQTLDDTDTWEHEIADASVAAEIPGIVNTGIHSTTAELELEPITGLDNTADIPPLSAAANASSREPEDPTLDVAINEFSLAELSAQEAEIDETDEPDKAHSLTDGLQTDNAALLDETFHGVALNVGEVKPELLQETVQGEAFLPEDVGSTTWGETLTGIPAAQLAKDIGSDDQPTPVAAQTVFAATGTTQTSSAITKWIVTGVCACILIGVVVFYYQFVTPTNRQMLSPEIAHGIENMGPPLHETLDLNIQPVTGVMEERVDVAMSDDISTSNISSTQSELIISETAEIVQETDVSESNIDQQMTEAGVEDTSVAALPVEAAPTLLPEDSSLALSETVRTQPALFKISRSKSTESKGQVVKDAYLAYQNGDYETATEKYEDTLAQFPANRDALLGLGAIASNQGDYARAYEWYARLLSANPQDEFAKTALISLQDKSELMGSESLIKTMLHDNPQRHFLHFTLGNIYAAGRRWAEAQQAFFDAYTLNSSNPDYALNLAISLDHMGLRGPALDYYTTALELANDTLARFDTSSVSTRADELRRAAGQ